MASARESTCFFPADVSAPPMATFQVVVGDPDSGEAHGVEVDGQDANRFLGRELGEEVDGTAVGLDGYTLEITGGSDAAGRPLRGDVGGPNLSEVLVAERSTGYRPDREGERRRVTVRGREISEEVVQINARVAARGDRSIDELLGADDDEADDEDE